jgi:uncharacterized protein YjbJ (UPF0337 family)
MSGNAAAVRDISQTKRLKHDRSNAMNWDQLEGKWKQYKGKVREQWGKLTDDDIDVIDGKRQQLIGKIQERYGIAKNAAETQADEFVNALQAEEYEQKKTHRAGQR